MAQKFLTDIEVTRGLVDSDGDLGVAGQVLSSTGTGTNWITNEANSTVVYQDGFTGDNSTVDFTLSVSVTDENVTQVYIDGVYQTKDTYSVSNTTLTFSTAPPLNADIEVITFSTATTADDLQAGVVIIPVKNTHTASIAKGEPVYITGNVGSSARLQIAPADASNSTKMPAAGLLLQTLAVNAEGYVVTGGYLRNITTDTIDGTSTSSNDTVYVKSGGGLTMTKPTGSNLIQNIAKVARVASGNAGSLLVSSILRTNDVPNLTTGKIWVGSANNTIESGTLHLDESNNRLGIGTTSPNAILHSYQGASGQSSVNVNANGLVIEDNASNGISILTPSSQIGSIFFGDQDDNFVGGFRYDHSNNSLQSYSNNAERMRIDSSGNVGIGTSSPTRQLTINGTTSTAINIKSNTTNGLSFLALGDADDDNYAQIILNNSTNKLQIQNGGGGAISNRGITLDSSENVGIGTSSPNFKLGLSNSNTLTAVYQQFTNGTTGTTSSDGTVMGIDSDGDFLINNQEAKEIKLYTSDTQRLTIQSGGNVGIGTTSPSYKLSVVNSGNVASFGDGTRAFRIYTDADEVSLLADGSVPMKFYTSGAERMRITSAGNVGIGTDSPYSFTQLHIYDTSDVIIGIQKGTANGYIINDGTNISLASDQGTTGKKLLVNRSAPDSSLVIDSSGNVGIGTTSPSAKLVINGDNYSISNSGQSLGGLDLTTNSNPGTGGYSAGISFGSTFSGRAAISGVQSNTSSDGDRQGLAFFTHASGTGSADSAEAMRLTSDGNLGIGTTSPTSKLDIAWGGYQTSGYALTFGADIGNLSTRTNNTTKYGIITGVPYTTTNPNIELFTYYSNNTSNALGIGGQGNTDLDGVNSIAFLTAPNQTSPGQIRMTIDSSGNVGIGTTSPVVKLNVVGSAYFSGNDAWNGGGSEGNRTDIALVIDEGDTIYTRDSNQYLRTLIKKDTGDNIQIGEAGTSLIDNINFYSGSSCSYTWYNNSSAAMKLTSAGLGIGTTSPSQKLDVNGNIKANGFLSGKGSNSITASGTADIINMSGTNGTYTVAIRVAGGSSIYIANAIFISHASNSEYIKAQDVYNGSNVTLSVSGTNVRITNNGFGTLTWEWSYFFQPFN